MSVAPSGTDVGAVYTDQTRVERFLPTSAIAGTADVTPVDGKILVSELNAFILQESRKIDARLEARGFEVPFPTIANTNPSPPQMVVDIVTYAVVGECRAKLKFGNRQTSSSKYYREESDKLLREILDCPKILGYAQVSAVEVLNKAIVTDQWGKLTATYYRLANRNVLEDSFRFVNSTGREVFRSDGLPFDLGRDFDFISQAEGTIILFNEPEILTQTGAGGGCVYKFSWRKLDYGQTTPTTLKGVSRL